ncbi:MAG TPA: quinoprotein dehydrogenase-associated putative ABC transporter substrate-binding protein [Bryobacteraceae bacterium]|nr:quinoprotein dehydrogenase-associated putative ABC transporter substrate-binding protein [Bryobacteraceae bacterium]
MSSVCSTIVAVCTCLGLATAADLHVCSDPDNLPYSNRQQQGFENQLAAMTARDLGRTVKYVWIPQRGPFFKALQQGACDMVMGVPTDFPAALTTQPYYRSTYVFASLRSKHLNIRSFDDKRLKTLRIGLQIVAEGDGDVPPAQALAHRGIVSNISWFRLNRNFLGAHRPASLLDAVEKGDIDVAIVWGPIAGSYARTASAPLALTPVSPQAEGDTPFAFNISMGVRPGDTNLKAALNSMIRGRRDEIRRLLDQFGVPEAPANR